MRERSRKDSARDRWGPHNQRPWRMRPGRPRIHRSDGAARRGRDCARCPPAIATCVDSDAGAV